MDQALKAACHGGSIHLLQSRGGPVELSALFRKCSRIIVWLGILLAIAIQGEKAWAQTSAAATRSPRLRAKVDDRRRVSIPGHRLPSLSRAAELGRVAGSTAMKQMVMVLQASAEQDHALRQLIDQQGDKNHPNFHRWMTPGEFADRFGVADDDIAQVTGWMAQYGLTVDRVSRNKRFIQFSGLVSQVEAAFHTEIHQYSAGGRHHIANAGDISVPETLKPVISGVPSLNDFFKTSQVLASRAAPEAKTPPPLHPEYTNGTTHFLGAGDFASVYNTTPLLSASPAIDGTGVTIGIVGRSNISVADVQLYREFFGLGVNDPVITIAGSDPGIVPSDDELSSLAVELSGGLAPGAAVNFITAKSTLTSDGADLAALYAVENNLTDIIGLTYTDCEANFTAAQASFYNTLWAQAAAQGQSVFVATGSSGPAACDNPNSTFSSFGYAVAMQASTPYNVAVGGTLFSDGSGSYWNTTATTAPPFSSALGYIPETPWNEAKGSGAVGATGLFASGSGISAYFPIPPWQHGFGVPLTDPAYPNGFKSDPASPFVPGPHRYLPDVSLAAAAQHDGALFCAEGICQLTSTSSLANAGIDGGTVAATAAMAGIQALVNQFNGGRQGVPNYVYYGLADNQHTAGLDCSAEAGGSTSADCAFHDIDTGNALVCGNTACSAGSKLGWTAAAGYDLASGLGSPNAYNLARLWSTVTFRSSTTTLQLSQTTGITHGQNVPVSGSVAPGAGTGTPTGTVAFFASSGALTDPISASTGDFQNPMATATLDGSGNYSISLTGLPAGTYNLTARYGGDGTFASSLSMPVQVTVSSESSSVTIQPNAFNGTTCIETPATTFSYGAFVWVDVTVAGASAQGVPTGTVTVTDNSSALVTVGLNPTGVGHFLSGANPATSCVNGKVFQNTAPLTGGTHILGASYSGDGSFNALTASPVTVTITPATVTGSLVTASSNISSSGSVRLAFTLAALLGAGPGTLAPTGTVTFTDTSTSTVLGTATLAATTTLGATAILTTTGISTSGANSITASWPGDTNYSAVTSSAVTVTVQGGTATSVAVTSNINPSTVGGRPTFTATMTPTTVTSGTVSFYDGATLLGSGTVGAAHTATFRPAATVNLPAGVHTITAIYAGNSTFNSSTSPGFAQSFTQPATTVQLTVLNSGVLGDKFGMSAVLGTLVAATPPSGIITFLDGSTPIGTASLATVATAGGGFGLFQAQIAPTLTVGTHTITATLADPNYTAAASNAQTITVSQATPTITINNIPSNAVFGGTYSPSVSYNGDGVASVTSNTTAVCTATAGLVSFVGMETCSLTASATAGTNYAAITGAAQTFTVHAAVPGAPQNVTAMAGNGSATVAFLAPASNGGSAITGYSVNCTPGPVTASGASSPILVSGLTNGTAYTCSVAATNSVGTGSAASASSVTPAAAPGAPQSVTATAGDGSATVAFGVAANNGSTITGYSVSCTPGPVTAAGATSPITVTGLTNGTAYLCSVTATNGVGTGPSAGASGTITPAGLPGPPQNVAATRGNGSVAVSFGAPASNNGSAITGYTAICNPGSITAMGVASPITVTGLTNGTAYTCSVAAVNGIGTGSPGGASSVTPAGPPSAPQNVMLVAGNGTATVSFTAPASDGGATITGYTVSCTPGPLTASGASSPIVVTGLTNGTPYSCSVAATNAAGTGPAAGAPSGGTPAGAPGAPQNVAATPGNGSVTVSFNAPATDNGSAITGYSAVCNPGSITAMGAASPITITGLTNGTVYTCSAAAVNSAGTGPAQNASGTVTPAGPPGAPQSVMATGGNASALISFGAPATNNGSAITGYVATCNPGPVMGMGTASPVSVTGLTNGTAYACSVAAVNGAGTGPAASASGSVTPAGVPGAPQNVMATAGIGSASISFGAPLTNGGSPITGYRATCNSVMMTGTSSPITVSGLTNGTAYTCSVAAINVVGTGLASAPAVVTPLSTPGAPQNVALVMGNGSATISFSAPASNGGSPITGYVAICSPGSITQAGPASPITLTGLSNGISYACSVAAVNAVGTGPAVTGSVAPSGAPGAPQNVIGTPGNGSAIISFSAPASNGGSQITAYVATCNPGSATKTSLSGPITVTGLTNGIAYTCSVAATNAAGAGPSTSAGTITPRGLPGPPQNVSGMAGNGSAVITFSAPSNTGGTSITGYVAVCNPGSVSSIGPSSPIVVAGLQNGTAYSCSVAALNAAGTGPSTAVSTSLTPGGQPGSPLNVTATAGDGAATVSFGPASGNGTMPITGYTVTCNPGSETSSASISPITVTGLTNGTAYTCTVSAHTASGTGSPSMGVVVIPATVPGPPLNPSANGSNGSAIVTFSPPASSGGSAITGYVVTCNPGPRTANGTSSPITITGLTNGTAYACTIAAINAVGQGPAATISNAVTPVAFTLVNGASFGVGALAPGAFGSLLGQDLAPFIYTAPAGALPTTLGNGTLTLIDSTMQELAMGLSYVSPTQVNFVVPENASLGPATLRLVVNGVIMTGPATVNAIQPGLFTLSSNGTGTAVANVLHVNSNGDRFYTDTTAPITFTAPDQKIYLIFYGTGFRKGASFTVTAGNVSLPVLYAGSQTVYPGLDQLNTELPGSLAGAGAVTVNLTVDGQAANPVSITIQ
jgi:hypothetical protein